jgi:DNA polymerase I-like protein with 3'-5' exonuclease and polymerase domains
MARFGAAIAMAPRAVIDFETTGVRPRFDALVSMGAYLPETDEAFYLNVGHHVADDRFPRYRETDLAAAMCPFVADTQRRLIMHNSAFDLRVFLKLGLDVRCAVSDTYTLMHRADENLTSFSASPTYHDAIDNVTYGLKQLITVFANERPPKLADAAAGYNAMSAEVKPVADYCIQDCVNTWFLYEHARKCFDRDADLRQLTDTIDDPNNVVLARMMWEGVGVDRDEAARQRELYKASIQACRNLIWNTLKINWPLETKREVLTVMRHMSIADEVDYDPFPQPFWTDDDPSVTREILEELFDDLRSPHKKYVVAAFLSLWTMKQRISSFINPMTEKATNGRLYLDRFSSTTASTRFSSSPNLQALPGRADELAGDITDNENPHPVRTLPDECRDHQRTRDLIVAKPDSYLVSFDLSAAEPRYLAMACQQALQTKEDNYRLARQRLQGMRKERYTPLLAVMYAKRNDTSYKEQPSEWPEIEEDPLWRVFADGGDPYEALLKAVDEEGYKAACEIDEGKWLKRNRHVGKKGFLALGYGSTAVSLAPKLGWTVERTQQAIENLERHYPTIPALKQLTFKELVHLGEIRTLWNRPRRINGYHQLARPFPLTIQFERRRTPDGRPHVRTYRADIIPLGTYRQGCQCFVEQCYILDTKEVVMKGNPDGTVAYMHPDDAFVHAQISDATFNYPPFANIPFSQIHWVQERDTGLIRHLPRQAKAERQAFNAIFQGTGADHLRWLMNTVDDEVCSRDEFQDCRLILTVHDSLLYEVPKSKWQSFVKATWPVLTRRPSWATIAIKIDAEVGIRFGHMKKLKSRHFRVR